MRICSVERPHAPSAGLRPEGTCCSSLQGGHSHRSHPLPQVGDPLPLDKFPFFLFGKERRVADVPTDHPSCSRQHAVIVFREVERASSLKTVVAPYIIDLETVNGTFVNGERIEASRCV